MAIIRRSKSSIHGLNADLQALMTADSNEAQARVEGDDTLTANLNTEVDDRTSEIARVDKAISDLSDATDANLKDAVDELTATVSDNADKAAADTAAVQANLDAEVTNRTDAVNDLQSKIDFITDNTDSGALDSLNEIVKAFQNADTDINGAISDLAKAREDALSQAVADQDVINKAHDDADAALDTRITDEVKTLNDTIAQEVTDRTDAVATALKKADNLSDVADVPTARANLSVDSSAEVSEKVRLGGAKFISESLTVDSDTITLTNVAKNDTIFNFAVVRHVDDTGIANDVPVTVDAAGSKKYNLHPDFSGQFDGKNVMVQYAYIPVS